MGSKIDSNLAPLKPHFPAATPASARNEPPQLQSLIDTLKLQEHIEGGYFVETDRDAYRVPNPFLSEQEASSSDQHTTFFTSSGAVSTDLSNKLTAADKDKQLQQKEQGDKDATRNASTSIHYLLTPSSPLGAFHRNKGRTIHTLHRGRGRYVLIHADEVIPSYDTHSGISGKARVETFIVGQDVAKGERLQWIVEGGKYKSSFLLPVEGSEDDTNEALLISETVVPGFEYTDHDFMKVDRLEALVTKEQADEMHWLLRRDDKPMV